MMQNSGLMNSLNTLGSLPMAYGIGLPILVTLRGSLDDKNMTQHPIGLATRGILDELRLDIFDLPRRQGLESTICSIAGMQSDVRRPYVLLVDGGEP
ncbi:sulfopyruvate decarboxylase TPP-binding subunit [Arthrobacter sp. UYEF3]